MSRRARIVGRGALTAAGQGVDRFWEAMRAAKPGLSTQPIGDSRLMEARFAALPTHRELKRDDLDLAGAWLRSACADALAEADPVLSQMEAPRLALIAGSSLGGMTLFETMRRGFWDPGGETGPGLPTGGQPGQGATLHDALYTGPTCRIGRVLGATAGAWTVNTACSSASNALGLGRLWLHKQRCDVALVAGFDAVSPFVFAGFSCLGAVDPEPTAPFCEDRRGLNLGDAAIALVMVNADAPAAAAAKGAVDVIGYGSSCDAHHLTRPDLTGHGVARAVKRALADADLQPPDVGMLSAHGTGTPFNDTMEAAAFATLFGDEQPPIHCAKPVTGHTLGAAGAVDALVVCEALVHGIAPATFCRGADDPKLTCHPARVEQPLRADAVALSTSSGFGGNNTALLFQRGNL